MARNALAAAIAFAAVSALATLPSPASAVVVPSGFVVENAVPGANFDTPVGVAFLPDGRMLVAEKRGRLYAVKDGVKHPTPMWSEEARVQSDGDRGLLGVAVDPNYAINRYVYLLYSVDPDSNNVEPGVGYGRLVRYQVSAADSNVFDPSSRAVLMGTSWADGPPDGSITHSIGSVRFGSDGTLLISAGEGAEFAHVDDGGEQPEMFGPGLADPDEDIGAYRSLYLGSLGGKILRIDPATGHGLPSNPFYDGDPTSDRSKVWAYGLRNPYRFTVKPGTGSANPTLGNPGTLYIGDVGWATWEELDVANQPGMNFGWPCYEGFLETPEYQTEGAPAHTGCDSFGTPDNPSLPSQPLAAWHHATPELSTPAGIRGSASIGGPFYTGNSFPALYHGVYFFGDFSYNWIKALVTDGNDQIVTLLDFAEDCQGPVDLEIDPTSGDLIYVSIYTNEIRRIRYGNPEGNTLPVADILATPSAGLAPLSVQFSSDGSYDLDGDPLSMSWLFGDGTGSTLTNPDHTYSTPGTYTAVLTANDGRGGIGRDSVIVVVANQALGFPTTPVLDDFDRPDGPLASPWVGAISGLYIDTNTLMQSDTWDWGVWDDQIFGTTQEAYFTLGALTPSSPEHNLMLKIQGTSWQNGCIEVRYDATVSLIRVGTYDPSIGWHTYETFPATLQPGDQMGARAYPSGLVEVYVNGALLGAASVSGWPYASNGGRIGMTLVEADQSRLDDFGGGDAVLNANTAPSATVLTPVDHSFFASGDTLYMTGAASDAQDLLSDLSIRWQIDLHHNIHVHPSTYVSTDPTASYVVQDHDDGSGVWYEILYIVTDTGGLSDTSRVSVYPEIDLEPSAITLVPDPPNNAGPTSYVFQLHNLGRMPASSSRWELTAGGISLANGLAIVPPLDSVRVVATVEAVLVPGDYQLRVTADTLNAVFETDEVNNGSTRPMTVFPAATGVEPHIHGLALSNAYPNPSAGPVRLALELPQASDVSFTIHDLQGRMVWSARPQRFQPGRHDLEWTGRTSGGQAARPGLYLARVDVGGRVMTRRLAILK